jgi:hypothetical protein
MVLLLIRYAGAWWLARGFALEAADYVVALLVRCRQR